MTNGHQTELSSRRILHSLLTFCLTCGRSLSSWRCVPRSWSSDHELFQSGARVQRGCPCGRCWSLNAACVRLNWWYWSSVRPICWFQPWSWTPWQPRASGLCDFRHMDPSETLTCRQYRRGSKVWLMPARTNARRFQSPGIHQAVDHGRRLLAAMRLHFGCVRRDSSLSSRARSS